MNLSQTDMQLALQIAHQAIKGTEKQSETDAAETSRILPHSLLQHSGCFVSVYIEQQLRGCIGTFSEEQPLHENIRKMAISSAYGDDRFPPVRPEEYHALCIEISILTPRVRIQDIDEIEIGKHGIYLISGMNRGTLLPQVAERNGWKPREFLEQCAQHKAGIGKDGWMHAEIYTYEAIIVRDQGLTVD